MKLSFALGLLLPLIAAADSANSLAVPVSLNTSTMGAVIKAAGSAVVDPTLTCNADYTLGLTCGNTTGPCTVSVTDISITNCVLTTPTPSP